MLFLKNNKLFSGLYLFLVLLTLLAIYKLGFKEAASQIAAQPERLRDITFRIWDSYSLSRHGLLVFYSLDDFDQKIAYSSHSTAYLFYMYVLYKIEMHFPTLQMRVVGALLDMISLAGVVFFIISRVAEKRIALMQGALILLAVVFMVSMPGFWISAARFNVDNPCPLIVAMIALISFFVWQDNARGKRVWISVLLFAIFSPSSCVLLGGALFLCAFHRDSVQKAYIKLGAVAVFLGVAFYLQAPVVAKMLGFASSNSGWLFRAGLDGGTIYFSNAVMSVLSPQLPRSLHIIAVPVLLLIGQYVYLYLLARAEKTTDVERDLLKGFPNSGIFYLLIFSQYIFSWLLWPQAIAIHPYLFDYYFLAPFSILIILLFLKFPSYFVLFRGWVLVLLFCISFNFQQVAQAKCSGCYYPAWSANK